MSGSGVVGELRRALRTIIPDDDGDSLDRAHALAWALTGLGWLFWSVAAVAFDYFGYCNRHGPHHPDAATGQTYPVNNHGDYRYIRPSDAHLYHAGFTVGFAGLATCAVLMLILFKPAVVRHILVTRRAGLIPIALFLVMAAGSLIGG